MLTFQKHIFKDRQRPDKTWVVYIRVTYNRRSKYVPTAFSVGKKGLTASFNIKDKLINDKCDEIVLSWRKRAAEMDLDVQEYTVEDIVEYLKKPRVEDVSFTDFAQKWINRHRDDVKGIKNYQTALNSFMQFVGGNIMCSAMGSKTLTEYVRWLKGKPRAQSLYTNAIVRMFNEAREEYNDEDKGLIIIRDTLRRFKPVRQNVAEKRAITAEQIRAIYNLPYLGKRPNGKMNNRRDLARDCFILSFCLMGMNSADMFNATDYDGETIYYERAKTKDRRNDHARMEVRVHPFVRPLVEKYRGRGRVFSFAERFSDMTQFNRSVNIGLKEIAGEIGLDDLQFYSARHSMATIAANDLRIDRYTVNLMLNHTDRAMKTTELYIRRDFAPLNDANARLIEYVFGDCSDK